MSCDSCNQDRGLVPSASCPLCGSAIALPVTPGSDNSRACPWDNMAVLGFGRALVDTLGFVLVQPSRFFRTKKICGTTRSALFFGVLLGWFGQTVHVGWRLVLGNSAAAGAMGREANGGAILALSVLLGPGIKIVQIVLLSMVCHWLLAFVKGQSKGLSATLQVIAFSMSAELFKIVPGIGVVASVVWQGVVIVLGLRAIHKISVMRVLLALVMPLAVLLLFFLVVSVLLTVALGGLGSSFVERLLQF